MNSLNLIIQSLDGEEITLCLPPNSNVRDVKSAISQQTGVPVATQRLLLKGKLMKDNCSLLDLDVQENQLVQLVASLEPEESPLTQLAQIVIDRDFGLLGIPRTPLRLTVPRTKHLEVLKQSAVTIDDLICSSWGALYDLSKRSFRVNQWVDVKDTVDQWLEAQVLQVRMGSVVPQCYVHYNGWPEQWDEWIDFDNERILPFRSRTRQNMKSSILSPLPYYSSMVESLSPQTLPELMGKLGIYIEYVRKILNTFRTINSQPEQLRREQCRQLNAAVLDRIGRMMSDAANYIARNRQLQYPPIRQAGGTSFGIDLYINPNEL